MNFKDRIKEYSLKPLLPNLTAGFFLTISYLIYAISYVTFIFKGHAIAYLPFGFNLFLYSIIVFTLFYTLFGAFSFVSININTTMIVLFTIVTKNISDQLYINQLQNQILPTVLTFIFIGTILIGLTFMALARLNLGNLFRYIPYPVIGGYSIGIGTLVIELILKNALSSSIKQYGFTSLVSSPEVYLFIFTVLFGVSLYFTQIKFKKPILFYGIIFLSIFIFYLILYAYSGNLNATAKYLWITEPAQSDNFSPFHLFSYLDQINWRILFYHSYDFLLLIILSVIGVPMTALNVEKALAKDININVEYMNSGFLNVFFALVGCTTATINLSATAQRFLMNGTSRSIGFIIAILCGAIMLVGPTLLGFIPSYVPGVVLITVSLSLIVPWIKEGFNNMLIKDNLIMLMVVFVVILSGLLYGVIFGILISIILFIFDYSETKIIRTLATGDTIHSSTQRSSKTLKILNHYRKTILYIKLQGFLFFGTSYLLYEKINLLLTKPNQCIRFMLLDFSLVTGVDSTLRLYFDKLYDLTKKYNFVIIITDIPEPIFQLFHKKKFLKLQNTAISIFTTYDAGLEYCENSILKNCIYDIKNQNFIEVVSEFIPDKNIILGLLSYFKRVNFEAGEEVFHEGDQSDAIYFIEKGELVAIIYQGTANETQLYKFSHGSLIGEMGTYSDMIRTASVKTTMPSVLLKLDKESLLRLEKQSPKLALTFQKLIIASLVERLIHANMKVNILLRN